MSCLILAAWSGFTYLPLALLLAVSIALLGLGGGAWISALAPMTAVDGDNPFAWRQGMSGKGCATGVYMFGGMVLLAIAAAPVVVPAIIWRDEPWVAIIGVVGIVWGAAVWMLGVRLGARRLMVRGPELIAELSPKSLT
ncbi:MAG: hypothetical protein R2705_07490 [Ilumatobacteraceae bacterium]